MLESLGFSYNGIHSEDLGVKLVTTKSGLFSENFLPERSIVEKKISRNDKPYFTRVEHSPLSFSLVLFIEKWRDYNNLRAIARWLFQDYYKPLIFDSNPNHIFYAIPEGQSNLVHNGCRDGYIEIDFRCDSPYSYSDIRETWLNVTNSSSFYLYNEGDIPVKPNFKFKKIGKGDIRVKDTLTGETMILKDIRDGEIVTINGRREEIISSAQEFNRYLYDNHNDVWLEIEADTQTEFELYGSFECSIYLEFAYLNMDSLNFDYF